jgi:hypothetical protein
MRGDSQLIGSPRLTAFPVQSSRQGTRTGQVATTFRLIAPSLGSAGSEFAIATEHGTAVHHAHRYRRHSSDRTSGLPSQCGVVVDGNRHARSAVHALGETRAALHHHRFSLPCQRSEPACCSGHCPPLRLQVTAPKQASEAGAAWRASKPRCNTCRLLFQCHEYRCLEHAFAVHCQPVLSLCSSMDHRPQQLSPRLLRVQGTDRQVMHSSL